MKLKLAHYRNRFSMFRTYYALRAGLVKTDGLEFTIVEVPDPPSRELEDVLIRGEVDISNVYLPNFLERRLDGAPIIGLCTEWKSTGKGNGLFVLQRRRSRSPADLEGRRVTTHQGRHAIHQYLLKKAYGVDSSTLKWAASPQETLIGILRRGEADAVVLLDQFFHHGEQADDIACLYTDGDAWKKLTGFDEMIKHMVAASESLIRQNPALHGALLRCVPRVVRLQRAQHGRGRGRVHQGLRRRPRGTADLRQLSAHGVHLHRHRAPAGAAPDGHVRRCRAAASATRRSKASS